MQATCGYYWLVRLEQAAAAARELTACTLMHTSELNLQLHERSEMRLLHGGTAVGC